MKTKQPISEAEESAYSLLIRSEERKRGVFEMVLYGLIILSAVAAILEFTVQSDPFPLLALPGSPVA